MKIFEWVCIGLTVTFLALVALYLRREIIAHRGGTIDMNVRLNTFLPERGWAPGLGRFVGDELRWFRMFSLSWRPRRVLSRRALVVQGRRAPEGEERLALPQGWVVVHCSGGGVPIDIALDEATLTGFLSWLESAPPGVRQH